MIKTERNNQKVSWVELLLSLDDMCTAKRDEQVLVSQFPIKESWQKQVRDKHIVFFYADTNFHYRYCGSIGERAQRYMDLLCSLGDSLGNMQDAVLWWFDDGSLRALIDAVEDEKERLKLERTYMWTIQLHLSKAVHDESGDFARALAWGDVYYGDTSSYWDEFHKVGKPVALYTFVNAGLALEDWLDTSLSEHAIPSLPAEWEECIQGRKVALFCIQPQTLLSAGQFAITLVENLTYLTQEREDICVWWVVDGWVDKTVSLLSVNLRLAFEETRRRFQESANTIYDESDEVARALKYADVTYGYPGDVMGRSAVRPVLEPPYYSLKTLPDCPQVGAFCREGATVYFNYTVRNVFAVLCKADLNTDKVKILCWLPNNEELTDWGLDYLLTVKAGEKIIMPPCFSNEGFIEYDTSSGKLTTISCEKMLWKQNLERYGAFGPIVEWGDSIFFMGNGNGLMVEYRKAENKYIYHEEWIKRLGFDNNPIFGGSELVGDTWYLAVSNAPVLLAMDMHTMMGKIVKFPLSQEFRPWMLSRCGNELWITPLVGNFLICMHLDGHEIELIKCPMVSSNQKFPFSAVVPWGQARLFIPYFADEVYIWQSDSHQAEPMPGLTHQLVRPFENTDLRNEVFWARQSECAGSFLSFRQRGTELIEFWPEKREIRYHKLKLEIQDEALLRNKINSWNLRNLLKPLFDEIDKLSWRQYSTAGERIWETVK